MLTPPSLTSDQKSDTAHVDTPHTTPPPDVPPPAYPSSNDYGRGITSEEVVAGASSPSTYPPPQSAPPFQHPGSSDTQQSSVGGMLPQQPQSTSLPAPPMTVAQQQAAAGLQYQHQLLAKCAQGQHEPTTTYGVCGIITAIVLFPIGLICLCSDTETKCARCGMRIESPATT